MPRPSLQRETARAYLGKTGMARLSELRAAGVTAATVSRMEKDGEMVRLARGLYQLSDAEIDPHHALAETAKRLPKAVVFLTSALAYHGLTDQLPRRTWIAIGHKDWAPMEAPSPLRIVRMTDALLADGVETHAIAGVKVKIFGVARTIVDCFKHRRAVGLAVALEGLQEALRQRKTTPCEIARRADGLCVGGVIRPYLEAMTANA